MFRVEPVIFGEIMKIKPPPKIEIVFLDTKKKIQEFEKSWNCYEREEDANRWPEPEFLEKL